MINSLGIDGNLVVHPSQKTSLEKVKEQSDVEVGQPVRWERIYSSFGKLHENVVDWNVKNTKDEHNHPGLFQEVLVVNVQVSKR